MASVEEIRALVKAKIEGQGTNVDAGSVLPVILNGILDLINEGGGGGGTSDAVQYIPQELTEAQKMQARKNQGLYYSEGGGEDVTITWDGDTTGLETIGNLLYKVTEESFSASEFKSVSFIRDGVEDTFVVGSSEIQVSENEEVWVISKEGGPICIVVTADEITENETTYTKGVWFVYGDANNRTSQLAYGQTETIHHIDPKYIKDMYYEGEGIGEKTIINPSPEYEWENPDSNFEYNYSTFKWFIGDAPTQSEIIGIRYSDDSTYIPGNSLQSAVVEGSDGKATMYAEDISDTTSSRRMFMVVSEDVSFGGSNHKKGIYFPDAPFDPYLYEIKYMGETTVVHQIPAKYIPSGGLQTYDIDVEWSELDGIIRSGYGYISWGSSNPETAYEEVCQALADGKMIALNIGQGSYGFPGGKLLSGNFVPLNKDYEDGDFASIVFKVYWPTYNQDTGTIIGYAEKLIRLVFHEGIESGDWSIMVKAEAVTV